MFLSKNYVLANEVVQHAGIHIANVSNMIKLLEDANESEGVVVKYGNCTFINRDAKNITNSFKEYIKTPGLKLTDFSDKLPITYVQTVLGVSFEILQESFGVNGFDLGEIVIAGKRFAIFPKSFVTLTKGKILYVLSKEDYISCLNNGDIQGGFALNSKKYLTWY